MAFKIYKKKQLLEIIKNKEAEITKLERKIAALRFEKNTNNTAEISEQELLYRLMDNIPDSIYFKDKKSRFIKVSKSFTQRHGFDSPEEVPGKTDFDIFADSHAQKAFDDEQKIMRTGKPLENIEEKETHNNGRVTWASTTKLPLKNRSGKIIGTFGISRDITEKKKNENALIAKEEKLRWLNAAKDKLFSIIAHDLKNPFSAIIGYSRLASEYIQDGKYEDAKEFCRTVTEASEKTMELLENLLQWAQSQKGMIAFEPKTFYVKPLINNTLKLFEPAIRKKNIEINNATEDKLKVWADEPMLKTIFRNLISNSVKFSNPNGKIEICAREEKKHIEFSVKDNGPGIDENQQNQIFSLESGKNSSKKSSGLGLILCKDFVRAHQGSICLNSKKNKGTEIIFRLPKKNS